MFGWTWLAWPDVLVDFGRELYVPWRLAGGSDLYVDVAYFNGPLSPYWNALWFRVFGPGIATLVAVNAILLMLLTGLLHHLLRKLLVGPLDLLQAQNVGLVPFEPQEQTLLTSADGVDVPGGDLHGARFPSPEAGQGS